MSGSAGSLHPLLGGQEQNPVYCRGSALVQIFWITGPSLLHPPKLTVFEIQAAWIPSGWPHRPSDVQGKISWPAFFIF